MLTSFTLCPHVQMTFVVFPYNICVFGQFSVDGMNSV